MNWLDKRFPKDREDAGLKGPVQKIITRIYKVKLIGGYIVQGELDETHHEEERLCVSFDENGIKTEQELLIYKDHTSKMIYNPKGEEIESIYYEFGKKNYHSLREHDDAGRLTKYIHLDKDNNITSAGTRIFNEKGHLVRYETYDKEMKITEFCDFIVDEKGYNLESKSVKFDSTIGTWTLYTNDDYGQAIVTKNLNPDGSILSIDRKTYHYDSEGEMIGIDDYLIPKEAPPKYLEYEHDHNGNCTLKVEFHQETPASMAVRDIIYYGDSNEDTVHSDEIIKIPYNMEKIKKNEAKKESSTNTAPAPLPPLEYKELEKSETKWLAEACSAETFPAVRYYSLKNNSLPSSSSYYGQDIDVITLMSELQQEMGAKIIHSNGQFNSSWYLPDLNSYTLIFPDKRYILQAHSINASEKSNYQIPDFFNKMNSGSYSYLFIGKLLLLHPEDEYGVRDEDFEEELNSYINLCTLEKAPELPEIQMVEVSPNGEFKLKTYPVHDNFIIKNLDLHYGYGFETFHNDLMNRFKNETKGLVLFHGEAGTGKTYYIRHLLRKMSGNKKVVIYMPPNMVERLADPVFITFLLKEIGRFSLAGNFCVLLVEDAEPLLASRQTEGRVIGVSNLLNLTDGLLNDMLKLQVICTFNVKIKELDKALLRPGRLIARKEFKAMSMIDANRLAQQLGVKHHFTHEASLAEVFAMLKNKNTLTHNPSENEDI